MKKRFKLIFNFLIFLSSLFIQGISYSEETNLEKNDLFKDERYACNQFYKQVEESSDPRVRNMYSYYEESGFGFSPAFAYDEESDKWSIYVDGTKIKVGSNYNNETAKLINPGDEIIKINGINPSVIVENGWWQYIENEEEVKELNLEIIDTKGIFKKVKLERSIDDWSHIFHSLRDLKIIDVDLKKSSYTLYVENAFDYRFDYTFYNDETKHPLIDIANNTIVFEGDNNVLLHICDPKPEYFTDRILPNPAGVFYPDVIENDIDLEKNKNSIWMYSKKQNFKDDVLNVQRIFKNNFKVLNDFNLKSFPFDRQMLKFRIVDNEFTIDSRVFEISPFSFRALNEYLSKDDIPGWEKISAEINEINYKRLTNADSYWSGLEVELLLERKHGYYIFKVILPMLLILAVCWSVVWVDPKELEARLTITIVCLLSLIAYNFVIDSELPKLEYLTVLDWIILISYVYATVPNFLSVISFRLQKTNLRLSNNLEIISRKYGLSSYILSILIIVWVNAFSNPDNTSSIISWMVLK